MQHEFLEMMGNLGYTNIYEMSQHSTSQIDVRYSLVNET